MAVRKSRAVQMICIVLSVILLGAAMFIALGSDHHCTGEDCPVCAAVESVSGLLVSGDAPREQTVATAALVITVEILLVSSRLEERSDPVTMRVRLLN